MLHTIFLFLFHFKLFIQSHLFSYFDKAFYDEINIFFCMACAYLCTDSCFSLRYNRVRECYNIYTFFHHTFCEFCCCLLIIEHNRYTWMCSRNNIKSVIYQLFPRQIIGIFGSESEAYFRFAEKFFRIFLFCTFINGLQPITANFFTAIGKANRGIFLSLTRQVIFLLPLMIILPIFFGIEGVMFSAPIADGFAAVCAITFAVKELKSFQKL